MNKLEENVDYELVPSGDDAWHIRILEGDFTESVIQLGAVKVNDETGEMNFNFELISSPDPDLSEENTGLQEYVGSLLLSIIETSLEKSEKNDNEH
jgi:hypothetical protein